MSYLNTGNKDACYGCNACKQVCNQNAISFIFDEEEFVYPNVDTNKCNNCKACQQVCPVGKDLFYYENQTVFGCYILDDDIRWNSTSGGAFSAIANAFCTNDYVIFGAKQLNAISVAHDYITDINSLHTFRKSKYVQSDIGDSYTRAKGFLDSGYKVLFSGTPCQIAGLKSYLGNNDYDNLLTIDVICASVPTPKFIKKFVEYIETKYQKKVTELDYRYTDYKLGPLKLQAWDFQVMYIGFSDYMRKGKNHYKLDRWVNPFWSIWLRLFMSRPSCYNCEYATRKRVADISLGDLWGVHIFCPELYDKNRGTSLVICNSSKGCKIMKLAAREMVVRELDIDTVSKYQSPLRGRIDTNPRRNEFMQDLDKLTYKEIVDKYYQKPSLRLLLSKYIWGNRQNVWVKTLFKQKG